MARLLLFAAGMGRRMEGSAKGLPKSLLPLPSGRSLLLENLTNGLHSGAIDCATIVTGYKVDEVERAVADFGLGDLVDTIFNPFFAGAGPLGSMWAAREVIRQGDFIMGNGDTLYGAEVFRAMSEPEPLALAYSLRETSVGDEVKVLLSENGHASAVGKDLTSSSWTGVSAGLFSVRGEQAQASVYGCLLEMMRSGKGAERGVIWHELVNQLVASGEVVQAVRVPASQWFEVDTSTDLIALQEAVARGQLRAVEYC